MATAGGLVPTEATQGVSPEGQPEWKVDQRVNAVWAGNGSYYSGSIAEVNAVERMVTVNWDDQQATHRTMAFDQLTNPSEETEAWSIAKIQNRTVVKDTPDKGRCLYAKQACEPGQVVFVEGPTQVTLPGISQNVWDHLVKLHEATPLNLGSVTFHFAALMSVLKLDKASIDIILDKFVPSPDEEPDEDALRIMQSIKENMPELNVKNGPADSRRYQKLVSAWRYNSFGHHKEDGLVLYNRISMCSHSCDPSCCWSYGNDDAFVLRARVALQAGDEITISYLQDDDLLKSTMARRQKLQNWQFTCGCTRCVLQVDTGRGFRCRKCHVGILYPGVSGTLERCTVCKTQLAKDDTATLINLEQEYVNRVENLDKTDVADVEAVYAAAMDIFDRHWILYIMDTMLWEAYREKKTLDAMAHQRRRIDYHEHYYCRPTFISAWCHEELGDCVVSKFPHRKWEFKQEYKSAYQSLAILCGSEHQYTASPYNKLLNASAAS